MIQETVQNVCPKCGSQSNVKQVEEFKRVFDQIGDAVYVIDGNFNIMEINQTCLKMFDLNPQQALEKKCYKVLYNLDKRCEDCPAIDAFRSREMTGGKIQHFNMRSIPVFNEEDNVNQIINHLKGTTELKEGNYLDEFDLLANTSEINAPIKMETDKLNLEITNPDIRTNIKEMAESLVRQVYKERAEIDLNIKLTIPEVMENSNSSTSEQGMLRQVLLNVVGNAIKFTEEGKVTIRMDVLPKNEQPK